MRFPQRIRRRRQEFILPRAAGRIESLEARLLLATDFASMLGFITRESAGLGPSSGRSLKNTIPGATPAVWSPEDETLQITNQFAGSPGDASFPLDLPSGNWQVLAGDWDGDGRDGIGLFESATATWVLFNDPSDRGSAIEFEFGPVGSSWQALAGDWDGNGRDSVGFYDPASSVWFLKNTLGQGVSDRVFPYGAIGRDWKPLVGDWDGNGSDGIGFYDPHVSQWFYKDEQEQGLSDLTFFYGPTDSSWQPLVGDWNSDGVPSPGFYDPTSTTWFLKNQSAQGISDQRFLFGHPRTEVRALVGDWDGSIAVHANRNVGEPTALLDLHTPGTSNQVVPTTIRLLEHNASFENEIGIFPVDDPAGRLGTLYPGDPGYVVAALNHPERWVLEASGDRAPKVLSRELPGDQLYASYLVQDRSAEEYLRLNPAGDKSWPVVFFSLPAGNPFGLTQVRYLAPDQMRWEDKGLDGDRDFNDEVLRIQFGRPRTADRLSLSFELAAQSDTPPLGDQATTAALVTLVGQTAPGAAVTVVGGSQSATAEVDGRFEITGVPLAAGANLIQLQASDNRGRTATADRTITRLLVNAAPTFNPGPNQNVLEDSGPAEIVGWAQDISPGDPSESGQIVTFSLTASDANLFAVQPVLLPNGTLRYTPAPNAFGSSMVSVIARDDGGTANGGHDTSPTRTFAISILPVNDRPTFTRGPDVSVAQGGPVYSQPWATNISVGPANEAVTQSAVFQVAIPDDQRSLFAAQPTISAAGQLMFQPAGNSSGVASVTMRLVDTGGTAQGGLDTSVDQQFTITIVSTAAQPNRAPSFTKGPDVSVDEDAPAQNIPWASGISPGPPTEAGQQVDFLMLPDDPTLFAAGGQPEIDGNGVLHFTAVADAFGSTQISVRAHDNGGTANGGSDTSEPQTFTIMIRPVNDRPTFSLASSVVDVDEDSPANQVPGFVANRSPGPPNENGQLTSLMVLDNTNPGLFAVAPSFADDGSLRFTPAADANGSALLTLILTDNGGTANSGIDTSLPQTLTITIEPVNDPPSFTLPSDRNRTVGNQDGPQTFSGFASALSAGPPDEAGQSLEFHLSVPPQQQSLFAALPAISRLGTLTFTPAAGQSGIANVTVQLIDHGGTLRGGVDSSPPVSFTITVEPTVTKQIQITPQPASQQTAPSSLVSLDVNFATSDANREIGGMHVRLHYNSQELVFQSASHRFTTALDLPAGVEPEPVDDSLTDFDQDSSTDRYVDLLWFSLNDDWPGVAVTYPLRLFTANFLTTAAFAGTTTLRFSTASVQVGYGFVGQPATISAAGGGNGPASGGLFQETAGGAASATTAATTGQGGRPAVNLDVDGNGLADGATDGKLLIRYLFGRTGTALTRGAIGTGATRTTPAQVSAYLSQAVDTFLDGDGNLTPDGATDGKLLIRYLFGQAGGRLIQGALGDDPFRFLSADIRRFFDRFNPNVDLGPSISSLSPQDGENLVSVTRETVVHFSQPVVPQDLLDDDAFYLVANEARVPGRVVVSQNATFATYFSDDLATSPLGDGSLPGSSLIQVFVDGNKIHGQDGKLLDADGDGLPGGLGRFTFRTVPISRLDNTSLSGRLVDANHRGPQGQEIPLVGATITVEGLGLTATTDANGRFRLDQVPAPDFYVEIDARGATSSAITNPGNQTYGRIRKPFHSVPGADIPMPFDIHLPLLTMSDFTPLSSTAPTAVKLGAEGLRLMTQVVRPDLDPSMWNLLEVEIPPESLYYNDGRQVPMASIVPMGSDRLPAPLPAWAEGANAPAFVFTVDGMGADNVDGEARIVYPNLDHVPLGEQRFIFAFDHDSGKWIPTGTMTAQLVDGHQVLVSDPGSGVRTLGWRFIGKPPGTDFDPKPPDNPPECPGFGFDDAWAIGKAITECAKALTSVGSALTAAFTVVDDLKEAKEKIENIKEDFQTGMISGITAREGIEAIEKTKDALKTAFEVFLEQNPVKKTLDAIKCGQEIVDQLTTRICKRQACLGSIGNFVCDRVKPLNKGIKDIRERLEKIEKAAEEGLVAGLCLALSTAADLFPKRPEGGSAEAPSGATMEEQIQGLNTLLQSISNDIANLQAAGETASLADSARTISSDIQKRAIVPLLQSLAAFRGDYYHLTVGTGPAAVSLRGRTAGSGDLNVPTIAAGQHYVLEIYDLQRDLVARAEGTSGSSGSVTRLKFQLTSVSDDLDSDGDRLSDVAESIVGTQVDDIDTDDDGVLDRAELEQGLNPHDGLSYPAGLAATLRLFGQAREVAVAGSSLDAQAEVACVATGDYGLAIVDVSNFQDPTILRQVDLPGTSTDVAIDRGRQLAVVVGVDTSAGSARILLHRVDISDPTSPVVDPRVTQIDDVFAGATDPVPRVELFDGLAYVSGRTGISVVDLTTGEVLDHIALSIASPGVVDLAREGTIMAALTPRLAGDESQLFVIDLSSGRPVVRGNVSVDFTAAGRVFLGTVPVAGDDDGRRIAYVSNGTQFEQGTLKLGGYSTVDLSSLSAPSLISRPDPLGGDINAQTGNFQTVANGTGRVVVAAGKLGLEVLDGSDPTATGALVLGFDPDRNHSTGAGLGVALIGGVGLLADGADGLRTIVYHQFDTGADRQPPVVKLDLTDQDADLASAGIQVPEGIRLGVVPLVSDNEQIHHVELLVDGQVVASDVDFPWDLVTALPRAASDRKSVAVQVRAVDTGGNLGRSQTLTLGLIPDLTPPRIAAQFPSDSEPMLSDDRVMWFRFSEALDPRSLVTTELGPNGPVDTQNFALQTSDGTSVPLQAVELVGGGTIVRLTLAGPLSVGQYRLVIDSAAVTDLAGNPLGNAPHLSSFSVVAPTIRWTAGSGDWSNANNWTDGSSQHRLPTASDIVAISRPDAAITVTFAMPHQTQMVQSLISRETLLLQSGLLELTANSSLTNAQVRESTTRNEPLDVRLDQQLFLSGRLVQSGGGWQGGGTLELTGAAAIVYGGINLATTLANHGQIDWLDWPINVYPGGQIQNSGIFRWSAGKNWYLKPGASGDTLINNEQGLIIHDSGGTTDFQGSWENRGRLQVLAGRATFQGGTKNTGTIEVRSPGTLDLKGTSTLAGTIAGSGNIVLFSNPSDDRLSAVISGVYRVTGKTTLGKNSLHFQGNSERTLDGPWEIRSGTFFADQPIKFGPLAHLTWSGDVISGSGPITIGGGGEFPGGGILQTPLIIADNPELDVDLVVSGTHDLHLQQNGSLENRGAIAIPAGSRITFDDNIFPQNPTVRRVKNVAGGTIHYASSSTNMFKVPLDNQGLFDLAAGKVEFKAGYSQSGDLAILHVWGGEAVDGNLTLSGGRLLADPGAVILGHVTNSGATIYPGGENIAGSLSIGKSGSAKNYVQTGTGSLVVDMVNNGVFDQLRVFGSATLDGTVSANFLDGFIPGEGAAFTVVDLLGVSPRTGTPTVVPASFAGGTLKFGVSSSGDLVLTTQPVSAGGAGQGPAAAIAPGLSGGIAPPNSWVGIPAAETSLEAVLASRAASLTAAGQPVQSQRPWSGSARDRLLAEWPRDSIQAHPILAPDSQLLRPRKAELLAAAELWAQWDEEST